MKQWHEIMAKCMSEGVKREDRTGVGTRALFGEMLEFNNIVACFPAVTTKKLAFKQVAAELTCFLRGYNTLAEFHSVGCTIWDANGTAPGWQPYLDGDLGRIYGVQMRSWDNSIDQMQHLVDGLKKSPHSRRHLVTMWNPSDLGDVCLPPCHYAFQCFVDGVYLDILVSMRSVDLFLGLPFDVASYALLQHIIAQQLNLVPRTLKFALGDAHIYLNHFEQVSIVLSRSPKSPPWLNLEYGATINNFEPVMAKLHGYECYDSVPAEMNV